MADNSGFDRFEPSPRHPELKASYEDLYALLSSPFERDFEAFGYHAHLTLPVSPDRPVHYGVDKEFFHDLTWHEIDKSRPWDIELGYSPDTDKLDLTQVEAPLKSSIEPGKKLILQHIRDNGYLMLTRSDAHPTPRIFTPPPTALFDREPSTEPDVVHTVTLPERTVKRYLADAGYGLPEIFTSPDDLRLYLADMTSSAESWTSKETITIPSPDSLQITLERHGSDRTSGLRSEIDTRLVATIEEVGSNRLTRQQLVITFEGEDYMVGQPTFVARTLELDQRDETVAKYGSEAYRVTRQEQVDANKALIEGLMNGIIEELSGGRH